MLLEGQCEMIICILQISTQGTISDILLDIAECYRRDSGDN